MEQIKEISNITIALPESALSIVLKYVVQSDFEKLNWSSSVEATLSAGDQENCCRKFRENSVMSVLESAFLELGMKDEETILHVTRRVEGWENYCSAEFLKMFFYHALSKNPNV